MLLHHYFRLASLLLGLGMTAQDRAVPSAASGDFAGAPARVAFDTHLAMERTSPYSGSRWQFVGPTNVTGRANAVAVGRGPKGPRIYVGYSGAGLWRSDDQGRTWEATFTREASTAVTAISVSSAAPNVVWLLTGTPFRSHYPVAGAGLFKSVDGGTTWSRSSLAQAGDFFGRIAIDPRTADTVYVSSLGGRLADDKSRGLFKTMDGGTTWKRICCGSANSGAGDFMMDPHDPRILYVATQPRPRGTEPPLTVPDTQRPTVLRSSDAGESWHEVSQGLPERRFRGRIALTGTGTRDLIYALVNNEETVPRPPGGGPDPLGPFGAGLTNWERGPEIYQSTDGGRQWTRMSRNDDSALRPADPRYNGTWHIRADPQDHKRIWTLGVFLGVSHDGGRTFSTVRGPHGDHNDMVIESGPAGRVFDCSDGGVYVLSRNGGSATLLTSPTAQVYNVELDGATPYNVYGSIQDHVSFRGAIDPARLRANAGPAPFEPAAGGEVTEHAAHPRIDNRVFAAMGLNGAGLRRFDVAAGGQSQVIRPRPPAGQLRGAWLLPLKLSPHNPDVLYVGYQYLFRSEDAGVSWKQVSHDLTDGGTNRRRPDHDNEAISTIDESPLQPGRLYAGTDDGHIFFSADAGGTWSELTDRLPQKRWVHRIVASRFDVDTVYVLQRGRNGGDFNPYLYKSTDNGRTFQSLTHGLPEVPVNVVREDPERRGVLYIGTDFGVYVSDAAGRSWYAVGTNLPIATVTDLQVKGDVIVVSTFGRGMWALDRTALKIPAAPQQPTGTNRGGRR